MRSQTFKLWMLLPVVAAGFLSPAAQAQNTFRVYAGLAPTTYNIEFDNNAPAGYRNKTAKSNYLATNVGVSWISPQRIYVDLSAQQSGSATHDLWKDIPAAPDQHFSHDSWALTAGYVHVLSQGMTISGFGGYRLGKTTLSAPKGATIPADGTLTWSEDVFKSKGVFFGAAWGMPALGGTINLSGALAFLGGTWSNDSTTNPYSNDAKATVGYSFNAGYTYRFGQGWGVTGDYRLQTYSYGFKATTNPAYNVKERISSIGAKVSYEF